MLLQIFAACPAPSSPQWTMRPAIGFRIGSAAAKASSEPPAMKVSVPAAAPPVPPETGASIDSSPCLLAMACALRADSTSMVEESMNSAPFLALGAMSS